MTTTPTRSAARSRSRAPKTAGVRRGAGRVTQRHGTTGTASNVYAQNPQCGLPAINTFVQPSCPEEDTPQGREEARRKTIEMYRRTFLTVTAGIQVVDFGNALIAGFGAGPYGRLFFAPNAPGTFSLTTNTSTHARVPDITISWDPFARVAPDASSIPVDLRSYGRVWSAVLGGQVTVETEPFATTIPIASAIKSVAGINASWTITPGMGSTSGRQLFYVNAIKESIHHQSPAPLNIEIPPDSAYRVLIGVPNRINNFVGGSAAAYPGFTYVWTGVLEVLQENNTRLTAFRLP